MFCDGQCKKGKKRCGLYWTVDIEDDKGKIEKVDRCGFIEMVLTNAKLSTQLTGIQSAAEDIRNGNKKHFAGMVQFLASCFEKLTYVIVSLAKRDATITVQDAEIKEIE